MSNNRQKQADYRGRIQHATRLPHPHLRLRILLACLASFCLFTGTAFGLVYADLFHTVKTTHKADKLIKRTPPPSDYYQGRAVNILVIGSDSRGNNNSNASLTNNEDVTQRSDTTMLVHISQDRSRIQVVSLPRDMLVDFPACPRSDGSVSPPQQDTQFNWAFSYGGGDRGDVDAAMACTWKTVEKFSGLQIDEAIIVDFSGFISMIDAIGGINVYVPQKIKDPRNTGLVIDEPGCKHFDGGQALQYARVRHGVEGGDGGDMQRMNRQQEVVGLMLREAKRKNILTSLNQLYGFLRGGLNSLTVSSGLSSFSAISGLAWSLHGIQPEQVVFINLPVVEDRSHLYRLRIYEQQADQLWAALRNDQPFPAGFPVRDGTGRTFVTEDPNQTASPSASANADGNKESQKPEENSDGQPGNSPEQPRQPSPAPTVNSTNTINKDDKEHAQEIARLQIECEGK